MSDEYKYNHLPEDHGAFPHFIHIDAPPPKEEYKYNPLAENHGAFPPVPPAPEPPPEDPITDNYKY